MSDRSAKEPAVEDDQNIKAGGKEDRKLEVIGIAILAIASFLTAWSGFQATKWSGVQASNYSQAGANRTMAGAASTTGVIYALNDQVNFNQWVTASTRGDEFLTGVYEERLQNNLPEAWEAWLALDPLNNPDAPPSPLGMPEYQFFNADEVAELESTADDHFQTGQNANQTADDYVLATVFFAIALFFSGISTSLNFRPVRLALLTIALVCVVFGGAWVATMPIEF